MGSSARFNEKSVVCERGRRVESENRAQPTICDTPKTQLGRAAIVVMEATEDRMCRDAVGLDGCIAFVGGAILWMRDASGSLGGSSVIVVLDIFIDDSLEMPFAEEDEVIETLVTDGPIEALDVGVGVGRAVGSWEPADSHRCSEPLIEMTAEAAELSLSASVRRKKCGKIPLHP
jgi:hypothetical protein